jgi:N-methylhydantoinase A
MRSVGIDVGGTFTDVIHLDEQTGRIDVDKVPTVSEDQSIGVMNAIDAVEVDLDDVDKLVHGTTVGINAILERGQTDVGLITTEGFRDILEMRRRDRPDNYGLKGQYDPLVPRELRTTVAERTDADGDVVEPVSEAEIEDAANALRDRGVDSVVVSFLHSYQNPENEEAAADVLEDVWPNDNVSVSSRLLPELKEFERTSTAAANAYVKPRIDHYIDNLTDKLTARDYGHELLVMQANRGVVTAPKTTPANTIFSGPSAGAIAGAHIGSKSGYDNVLSVDMGGTSFDATLVTDGEVETTTEKSVEFGVPIQLPMVDVQSIGSGGGSIAWLDTGNVLNVGPRSAGADPGPICYDNGGTEPTITDAHAVLGRIDPGIFADEPILGEVETRLDEEIGSELGVTTTEAAQAILDVVNDDMASLLRLMTIDRGFDPREFALMAYGGAGPMHAVELARELSIGTVLIPPFPGVISAFGLLVAESRFDYVETVNETVDDLDMAEIESICEEQARQGREEMQAQEIDFERVESQFQADLHYQGQAHIVQTDLDLDELSEETLIDWFESEYERRYHHTIDDMPVTVRSVRTVTTGYNKQPDFSDFVHSGTGDAEAARTHTRDIHFDGTAVSTPVYDRFELPREETIEGPCIMEEPDTTIVIPPNTTAQIDENGTIVIEVTDR